MHTYINIHITYIRANLYFFSVSMGFLGFYVVVCMCRVDRIGNTCAFLLRLCGEFKPPPPPQPQCDTRSNAAYVKRPRVRRVFKLNLFLSVNASMVRLSALRQDLPQFKCRYSPASRSRFCSVQRDSLPDAVLCDAEHLLSKSRWRFPVGACHTVSTDLSHLKIMTR